MPDYASLLDQARERTARQYSCAIGRRRDELVTPALVLDVDAAQRNIDHMAGALREMGTATIRPHYKTHKSPEIAAPGTTASPPCPRFAAQPGRLRRYGSAGRRAGNRAPGRAASGC